MQKGVQLETQIQETRTSWAATLPAPQPMLSPSSTLSPYLSQCAFIPSKRNFCARFKSIIILFLLFKIAQIWNCASLSYINREFLYVGW